MNVHIGFTQRISNWAKGKSSNDDDSAIARKEGERETSRNGASREIDQRKQLFDDIGSFLFAHDLDLTPVNFGLALDYLTGSDFEIEKAVRHLLTERGYIDNGLAEKIIAKRHSGEITVERLSTMLTSVEENLDRFTMLANESSKSATDYGEALEAQVNDASDDQESPQEMVAALIGLTRSMVQKTRKIEVEMRESQKKNSALQQSLATARKIAEQDHLTGLPNRRAFENALKDEVRVASEYHEPLSIAFCDIDNFKTINDGHGHDTGDRVLRFVGSLLAKISSEKCHVARHGGEEFVLLFRGKNVEEAREIVDDTRADLASRNLVDRNTGERMAQVSFSAGVADIFSYDSPREALKAADRALYLAKAHGRNRVYAAAGGPIAPE